ncbi:MAG: NUDIX domain-containing protein [Pirellulales bacterium]
MAGCEPPSDRSGVVAVIRRDERLLVIRRAQCVAAPGMLCFPGGGVEAGESEPQTLVRELREELNVRVLPVRRLWKSRTPWNVTLYWWLADLPMHERPAANPAEVAAIHWYTPREMAALGDLLRSNHAFLAALAGAEFTLEPRE